MCVNILSIEVNAIHYYTYYIYIRTLRTFEEFAVVQGCKQDFVAVDFQKSKRCSESIFKIHNYYIS